MRISSSYKKGNSLKDACIWLLFSCLFSGSSHAQSLKADFVKQPLNTATNKYYVTNKAPLQLPFFVKLPLTAIKPGGWLKKQIELQRDGLTGNLGEISIWLSKKDNAWLNKDGNGKYGWEELPYWLKGYGNIGYML